MEFSTHNCKTCNLELFYSEPLWFEKGLQDNEDQLHHDDLKIKDALEHELDKLENEGTQINLKISEGSFCHWCKDPVTDLHPFICKRHTIFVDDGFLPLSCCIDCSEIIPRLKSEEI